MLNELLIAEKGAREAGLAMTERHPDVKDGRRVPTLVVGLAADGTAASLRPLAPDVTPWTLRDGQHNSFPFVQKAPLALTVSPENVTLREIALDKKAEPTARRSALLDLVSKQPPGTVYPEWPGGGLVRRLRERRQQLRSLQGSLGGIVPETIERFLHAVDPEKGGDPRRLLQNLAERLASELRYTAQADWLEVALAIFIGELEKAKNTWGSSGALLFETEEAELPIFHARIEQEVSRALRAAEEADADSGQTGICGLTGLQTRLLSGSFPQPNLPVLGQTFLFARNPDIQAQGRYGRFATAAMPAGKDAAIRLAAAFEALTSADRRDKTWRPIPGEAPKQSDLLLAVAEAAPDFPAAWILGHDESDEDFSEELSDDPERAVADSIAAFEKRAQRAIDAVQAKLGADFRLTPVQVAVFRKVDLANRKVVYAGKAVVAELYQAALSWVEGERNVPGWFSLATFHKGERKPRPSAPPHLAPLGLIRFSKQLFLRHGKERCEVVGLPAGEALALFMEPVTAKAHSARRRAERALWLVLARRAALISAVAHAVWRREGTPKDLDFREALRTVTMLGLLLHKLGRNKEVYVSDTAFKLGQLLAAADVVHAGYCADVRDGSLPPSLLGNQVFNMAQSSPVKALAALCRRWKPYDGWAQKAARNLQYVESLVASQDKGKSQRGWAIRRALRHAREMKPLAQELAESLAEFKADDAFRAELLLGYIAGLPKSQRNEGSATDQDEDTIGQED